MKIWHDVLLRHIISSMDPCGAYFLASSNGRVAQRIRRLTTNQKIVGSNPIVIIFSNSGSAIKLIVKITSARAGFEHTLRSRGPTDKASDYESEDCGFESHRDHFQPIVFDTQRIDRKNLPLRVGFEPTREDPI